MAHSPSLFLFFHNPDVSISKTSHSLSCPSGELISELQTLIQASQDKLFTRYQSSRVWSFKLMAALEKTKLFVKIRRASISATSQVWKQRVLHCLWEPGLDQKTVCRWRGPRGSTHWILLNFCDHYNSSISHRWKLPELIYMPHRQNRKPGTPVKIRVQSNITAYICSYAWATEYSSSLSGPWTKKSMRQHLNFNCFSFLSRKLLFMRSTFFYKFSQQSEDQQKKNILQ